MAATGRRSARLGVREGLSGNGAIKGAGATRAVAAGTLGDWLGELELRVVEAARELLAHDGSPAAADGGVGSGDPDTVDFDTTLDSTDTEWDLILGLLVQFRHRLRLEHFRRLRILALVDFAVLAQPVLVIGKLDKTTKDGDNDSASKNLAGSC